ncbi:MAG: tetratricopeptide repeat protein [Planctomycetota bacterium]
MPSAPPRARAPRAWALAALLWTACSQDPATFVAPRLADRTGVDPFKLDAIDAAIGALERGEEGALLELGKVYDANGLAEFADTIYRQCLAEAGTDARARTRLLYLLALNLEGLGRAEEALAAYDEVLTLEQDYAPTHWRRGELLFEFGRLAEARAAYERALALEPHSIQAHLGRARVLLLEEDWRGAIAELEPLVERVSDERYVHGLLARAYRALGDTERAALELKRDQKSERISMGDPRSGEVRARAVGVLAGVRRANEAMLDGRNREALEILAPLHARLPEDLALLQMVAKAHLAGLQYDAALAVLEPALKLHPDQFKLELFLGLALDGKKQPQRALPHLLRACELSPGYGPAHSAAGETLTKLRRFAEAEAAFLQALEMGEEDLRTRLLLGQVQLEQGAFERVLTTARAATRAFPRGAAAWSFQAEAEARAGLSDEAARSLAEAERLNPDYERLPAVRALLEGEAKAR